MISKSLLCLIQTVNVVYLCVLLIGISLCSLFPDLVHLTCPSAKTAREDLEPVVQKLFNLNTEKGKTKKIGIMIQACINIIY